MAKFILFDELIKPGDKWKTPEQHGWIRISLYTGEPRLNELSDKVTYWINEYIEGKWTWWYFSRTSKKDRPPSGISFAFEIELDAMAFKLMWI